MDSALEQALAAWREFRESNPEVYFHPGSRLDQAWETLDGALEDLDQVATEKRNALPPLTA